MSRGARRAVPDSGGEGSSTRLLLSVAKQNRRSLIGAMGATVLVTAADLAAPWPIKWVIDDVVAGRTTAFHFTAGDVRVLALVALATIGISLLNAFGVYSGDLLLRQSGERISHGLRVRTYEQLQRLSIAFHDRRPKGDLVTRMTDDANRVGEVFSESLGTIAQSVLVVVGMLSLSLWLDPLLGLVLATVVPMLALVTHHFRREVRAAAKRQRARDGDIASLAAESLSSMRLVLASGTEAVEHEKVRVQSDERRRSGIQVAVLEARFAGFVDVIGALTMALVIVLGSWRVASGDLSAGSLVVFAQYARRLYRPLKDVAKHSGRISKALARADRIAEILASDERLADDPRGHAGGRARGRLTFRDVSFHYRWDQPVLQGIDLDLPSCSRTAVVGASGAGKSTLGALVARFYDPTEGSVALDGRDLRTCSLRWLRSQVGILLQDTVLLTGTVAENIAYGSSASREQVEAAARIAGAHGFISQLSGGYDHRLGAHGVGLSGGQRQRIGIARVLLRDPAVLLLDEPTTGLDPLTEAEVMDGLTALMAGRTTVIVTHSIPLALSAERVVVLGDGQVVEQGDPAVLLARGGAFARLAAQQGVRTPAAWDRLLRTPAPVSRGLEVRP